jgi:multidrug efflux system outer membrane protein
LASSAAAPLEAAQPAATATPSTPSGPPALPDWQRCYTDPRLHALIGLALDNNRDLRIAAARVREAQAQYGLAQADRWPALTALGQGLSQRVPTEFDRTTNQRRYDLNVGVSGHELDFWGRLARASEAARNSLLATEAGRQATRIELIAMVANTHHLLLQFDAQIELAEAATSAHRQSLGLITQGRDIGGADELAWQQASSLLAASEMNLEGLRQERERARNQLVALVGSPLDDLPAGATINDPGLSADMQPGLPSEVLLSRPDVIAAEHRLQAAHANVAAARLAFLPRMALTASMGVASSGLSSLFKAGAWAFQPVMSMPIFDAGRNDAAVDLAQARQDLAVADYERTLQQAFREVADALSGRAALAAQRRSAQLSEQALQTRVAISRAKAQAGIVSLLDVLESERQLYAAQTTTAAIRRAELDTQTVLIKALGIGAEPPAEQKLASGSAEPSAAPNQE